MVILRYFLIALTSLAGGAALVAWTSFLVMTFAIAGAKRSEWAPGIAEETIWEKTATQRRWRLKATVRFLTAIGVAVLCGGLLAALPLP
jgi:hypothetical protein